MNLEEITTRWRGKTHAVPKWIAPITAQLCALLDEREYVGIASVDAAVKAFEQKTGDALIGGDVNKPRTMGGVLLRLAKRNKDARRAIYAQQAQL